MKNQTKQEQFNKITMKELMTGLGIDKNDIVFVKNETLICNDVYDLVRLTANVSHGGGYSQNIPNIILSMVSGKTPYRVYRTSSILFVDETTQSNTDDIKELTLKIIKDKEDKNNGR